MAAPYQQPPPPAFAPPPVPEGWKAEWSVEHNTWYYLDLSTRVSQWHNPLGQSLQPQSPPPLFGGSPATQQYPTPPQQGTPSSFGGSPTPGSDGQPGAAAGYFGGALPPQQYAPGQEQPGYGDQGGVGPGDGERGLGKVGGGLLGAGAALLAGAFIKHEIQDHKANKLGGFFGGNTATSSPRPAAGGLFGSIGSHLPFGGNNSTPPPQPAAYPAAGGGFMASVGSHLPFGGNNSAPSPQPAVNTPAGGGFLASVGSHMPFGGGNPSDPPLYIHAAALAEKDITQGIRAMVKPDQSLEVNTKELASTFGDPWPENGHKQFSVLYSYGQRPWELVAYEVASGTVTIVPHQPLDKTRMEFVQDPRSRVVALVWGMENGLAEGKGKGTTAKLQQLESTGEFEATNDWMGFDGMWGYSKSAVVYYRLSNGGIGVTGARTETTCRLPWNPLAKWT